MKICVVEDYENRIEAFQMLLHPHDLTICRNASEATQAVTSTKFDIIFLDHDLGSESENTGYEVSKNIAGNINDTTPIVIHSMNPVGAQNIESQLRNNPKARVPFGSIKIDILDTKPWIR